MVNLSLKVLRNRFHWFQQLTACFHPVPLRFLEPSLEPVWNQEPGRNQRETAHDLQEP